MRKTYLNIFKVIIMMSLVFCFIANANTLQAQKSDNSGEKIAFIRNGDIWLMNPDGTNQRPWVTQMANTRGRLSWTPDGKILVFSRQGSVNISYPEGGGGNHRIYDLFYAYIDSIGIRDNYWLGFTNTMGAQYPQFTKDGSLLMFSYDLEANKINATSPDYTIGFLDPVNDEMRTLSLPEGGPKLMALMPTISPDGKKVCFVLGIFQKANISKQGLVIVPSDSITMNAQELVDMAKKVTDASSPAWSPNGKHIAFLNNDGLFVTDPQLSEPRLVTKPEEGLWMSGVPCWSPDSKKLAFTTSNGSIYVVGLDGSGMKKISGPGNDSNPAWTD